MTTAASKRRLRIPVRFVDGIWESWVAGIIPVEEGAEAELVVDRECVSDGAFLRAMERKGHHKILDEGTTLLVILTVKPEHPLPLDLVPFLKSCSDLRGTLATEVFDVCDPGTAQLVEVRLAGPDRRQAQLFDTNRGGLWLMTHGIEAVGLAPTRVLLPAEISPRPVASLNHAYTKLSETFEIGRISHTGNIYTHVLYQERDGTWYPLDRLRRKVLDEQRQEIATDLWEGFMARMSNRKADDGGHVSR